MERAEKCNLVDGFVIGRDRIFVSHLQFVDDTILFSSRDEVKIKSLKIVDIFGIISGLKINMEKSTIMGINISKDKIDRLDLELGCLVGG